MLAVGVVGVEGLEVWLQRLELGFAHLPMLGVAAGQDGGHDDQMARIEIGSGDLAFQLRIPKIVPAVELDVFDQIVAITDRVDIGPGAEVIGADPRFIDEILGVRNFRMSSF